MFDKFGGLIYRSVDGTQGPRNVHVLVIEYNVILVEYFTCYISKEMYLFL